MTVTRKTSRRIQNVYVFVNYIKLYKHFFQFYKFLWFRFEKKANRMLKKASQTLGQSTGLNLGTRRPTLMGNYYL